MWARAKKAGRTSTFIAVTMLVVLALLGLGGFAYPRLQHAAAGSHESVTSAPEGSRALPEPARIAKVVERPSVICTAPIVGECEPDELGAGPVRAEMNPRPALVSVKTESPLPNPSKSGSGLPLTGVPQTGADRKASPTRQPFRGISPAAELDKRPAVPANSLRASSDEQGGEDQTPEGGAAPQPSVYDLPPIEGHVVNVSKLPVAGPTPPPKEREGAENAEAALRQEFAKRFEGIQVDPALVQNANDPSTPSSTLIPVGGPVVVEAAPGASTPSFQEYKMLAGWSGGPPDVDMAAGLSYLITDVNSYFRIYDKTGVKQGGDYSFSSFFSSLAHCGDANSYGVCDPQMVYDDENDRYVFTALAVGASDSYICLGASQTGDPRALWNTYEINPGVSTIVVYDYPHTAIGQDAIFISTNDFATAYTNVMILAINKANAYAGSALQTRVGTLASTYYTPRPAVRRGFNQGQYPPSGKPHYFVYTNNTSGNAGLISWPQPTFTSSPAAVAGWSDTTPGLAVDPSNAAYTYKPIDPLGTKVMDAELRWPYLWFVRTGVSSGADLLRWGAVDVSLSTPATVSGMSGSTGGGATEHWWMPDCTVDKNNSLAIGYMRAGSTGPIYVGSYVTGHDNGSTPTGAGLLETPVASKAGEAIFAGYYQDNIGAYRDGDYTACQVDPDGCTIWVHGEYSYNNPINTQTDATWVRKFQFADCTPGATRYANMNASFYQCYKPVSATITDTGGTPTNAAYHSTTGGSYGATISGGPGTFTVSPVTVNQIAAADGDDIWLSFTGDDGLTYNSIHSKLDCSPNVCVAGVDALSGGCDGDIYMDNGETLNVNVAMVNNELYPLSTGFYADLVVDPAYPDANVTIVNGTTVWSALSAGETAYASGRPFQVRYTGSGPGPILVHFKVQNIRATDSSWTGNSSCSANSFTEYADTNDQLASTLVSEGFEGTFPPTNWVNTSNVTGTAAWAKSTGMTHPTMSAHTGTGMAYFNAYSFSTVGSQARLATPVISLSGTTLPKVSFWMTHDTTYASYDDNLSIQVSTNGGTSYATVPDAIFHRNQGGTAAGVWLNHSVDLSAYKVANVRVGFLATSAYGDNFSIDDVLVGNYNRVNDTSVCAGAPILSNGKYDWTFDDSQCNNDPGDTSVWQWYTPGWSDDAGESGTLTFYLGNSGNENAYNVSATLTCPTCPAGVSICKATANYGTIPYGTSYVYSPGSDGFEIALAPTVTAGQNLPFVMTITTSNSPAYNPIISIDSAPPIDPFNIKTGTPTLLATSPSRDNTMEDHFTTDPYTAGAGGRLGFSSAWTGSGASVSTAYSSDGDGSSMKLPVNGTTAIHAWPLNTQGIDCDIMYYFDVNLLGAATSKFFFEYTNDGATWVSLNGTGYTGTAASNWYYSSNSLYFLIKAVSGQAAAQAMYNNPNFALRFRTTGTGTSADYVDNFQLAYYKYTNKATTCTGACASPDAPRIDLIVDNDPCAVTGIKVYYTGSLGAASYDLIKDGVTGTPAVVGYVSGTTYAPGDATSHSYTIRANNTSGGKQSPAYAFADGGPITPTITGGSTNVCPANTVTLTTQTGMNSYQWYKDGGAIGGANSATYAVPYTDGLSHNYTVYYRAGNCTGTSASHAVTVVACPPDLAYDSSYTPVLTQVCGNGNAVVEPGEQWDVTVRLKNVGSGGATNVTATLSVAADTQVAATIQGSPASFGAIAAGGTAIAHFQFLVDTALVCSAGPKSLRFDVTNLTCTEHSAFPGTTDAVTVQVGGTSATQDQTGTQQTSPLSATSGSADSLLGPTNNFTITNPEDWAKISYTPNTPAYVQGVGSTATLFGPDDFTSTISNWTPVSTVWNAGTAHCSVMNNGVAYMGSSSGAANPSITLVSPVSTVGYTNINVQFSLTLGAKGDSVTMDWYDGTTWATAYSLTNNATWQCNVNQVLPVGAAGKAGFKIRFTATTSRNNFTQVDYVSITGQPLSGNWQANARVSLVDPSSNVTVIKAYGASDPASPYTLPASAYSGPGTYKLRLEENAGGTASVTALSPGLEVYKAGATICSNAGCTACVAPTQMATTAADKDGCADTGVDVTWSDPTSWGDSSSSGRGFDVWRDTVPSTGATKLTASPLSAATHTYNDNTGTNNTLYTYYVVATNNCALSMAYTASSSVQDQVGVAPTVMTTTAADKDPVADTGVDVTWAAPTTWGDNGTNTAGRGFNVWRNDVPPTSPTKLTASPLSAATTTYNDNTGTNNVAYTYYAEAVNGCGLSSAYVESSPVADAVCTAPTAMTTVAADADPNLDTGVNISWADPTQWGDNGNGTRSFEVWRNSVPPGSSGLITTLSEGVYAYNDNTGINNTLYTYTVKAVNGCNQATAYSTSAQVQDAVTTPGEVAPGTSSSDAQSWTDVNTQTWPSATGVTGYNLYRGQAADLPNLLTSGTDSCTKYSGATNSADCTGDDPTTLSAGDFYWYIVTAVNGAIEGTAGNATGGPRTLDTSGVCP